MVPSTPATVAPTILVVEDTSSLRELLVFVLQQEGYIVEAVADGAAAIRVLDHYRATRGLSLVLLDMVLPEVDGLDVLQHLSVLGRYVPVVTLSASSIGRAEAAAAGARATLAKPFQLDELLDVIARICGRPAPLPAAD